MCFKACGRAAMALLSVVACATANAQVSPGGLLTYGATAVRETFPSTAPIVQLTCNIYTNIGLRADGTIICWGDNSNGRATPPANLINVVQIASGFGHNLALKSDGTVVAWGLNDQNQCNVPAGLNNVKSVWAGDNQSFAIKTDGTLVYWGNGYAPPAGLTSIKMITAGDTFAYALKTDGTLVGWGTNGYGQLNMPAGVNGNVVQVSSCKLRTVALLADGTVAAWGANFSGENNIPAGFGNIKKIAAGYSHTIAIKNDGTVVGFGMNGQGQVSPPAAANGAIEVGANYSFSSALMPDGKVISFGESNWNQSVTPNFKGATRVDGMYGCVVGVDPAGKPVYWGRNDWGQANIPATLVNVTSLSIGYRHGIALQADGKVVCWGNNWDNQCSVPASAVGITQISAGTYHSAAYKGPNGLWLWGYNGSGQCTIPPNLGNISQVAATASNTAVLKADGTVVAWGDNFFGANNVPAGLSGVTSLVSGNGHFLALKSNGTVASWGWNTGSFLKTPVGLSDVVQISAGDSHAAGLKSDGTVAVWGYDGYGQIAGTQGLGNVAKVIATGNMTVCVMKMYVSVAPWRIMGGASATGTVYLANPAPAGGTTVALSTSDASLIVPANVVVPAGATSVDFTVNTTNPSGDIKAAVYATLGSLTQKSLLTVLQSPLSLTLSKPTLVGGSASPLKGTITLANPAPAGGLTINVTSSSATCTVPATVFIPAGKMTKDFTIAHSRVDVNTNATFDINYASLSSSATVSLTPFLITNFSVDSVFVMGTGTIQASVTLNAIPVAPLSVPITSTLTSAVPDGVIVVPSGDKKGIASLPTNSVANIANLTLTATVGNATAKAIKVYPGLTSVKFDAGNWYGNGSLPCTVTIPIAAPVGGWTVNLSSSNCQVPASVVVPAGSTTVTINAIANDVVESVIGSVQASAGSVTSVATRAIGRNLIQSFTVDPMTFVGGSATAVTGTITLVAPVAVDTPVQVSVSITAVGAPAIVIVPAGQSSVTFPITHSAVTSPKSAKVTALRLGISTKVTLTVN